MTDRLFCIRRLIADITEEINADMDPHGIVRLMQPFTVLVIPDDDIQRNSFAEIIHDHPGINFLYDRRTLLGMEVRNANRIFSARNDVSMPHLRWYRYFKILNYQTDSSLLEAESILGSMTKEEYDQAVRVLHALKQK